MRLSTIALSLALAGALPSLLAAEAGAELPVVQASDQDRLDMQPRVSDVDFLTGHWTGTDGQSDWESSYTSGTGGQLVGASEEMRGGRVVMIDFEHFYESEGQLRMTPYPFGKPSVEFALTQFDAKARSALFENPEHDFPKSFRYHRTGRKTLEITLEGDLGGRAASFVLKLTRSRD